MIFLVKVGSIYGNEDRDGDSQEPQREAGTFYGQAAARISCQGNAGGTAGSGRGGSTSPMIEALQREDYTGFASIYNGPGQAPVYGARIEVT